MHWQLRSSWLGTFDSLIERAVLEILKGEFDMSERFNYYYNMSREYVPFSQFLFLYN